MLEAKGTTIYMAEGDYGLQLPFGIKGTTLAAGDSIRFTFKDKENGTTILEKEYTNITQNLGNLEFTQEESGLFGVGNYVYRMDWYQNGNFMCNIIPLGLFKVGDKA